MDERRHFGSDWLRIGAFGVLIFYHIGLVVVPGDWHVKSAPTIDWVILPMAAVAIGLTAFALSNIRGRLGSRASSTDCERLSA